jgi:hypothetical protein
MQVGIAELAEQLQIEAWVLNADCEVGMDLRRQELLQSASYLVCVIVARQSSFGVLAFPIIL